MLEYDWQYNFICDECGEKREFYRADMKESLETLKSTGWLIEGGLNLCPKCRMEYEEPCKLCKWYKDEVCKNIQSENIEEYVLPNMHCDFWEKGI